MARKNEFGSSWWAKRWNNTLESYGYGSRLQRGKTYARAGNVLEISIKPGEVTAKVQGSRRTPYKISIKLNSIKRADWDKAIKLMAEKAIFSVKLLNGEMPDNIEEAFSASGVSLFPARSSDLITDCSCPDFANPCKHIAAVYYTLGVEFDRDPFMIFRLRGMDKEEVLEQLRKIRAAKTEPTSPDAEEITVDDALAENPLDSLKKQLMDHKGLSSSITDMQFNFDQPKVPLYVIRLLGVPEFYKDNMNFFDDMKRIYSKTSEGLVKSLKLP